MSMSLNDLAYRLAEEIKESEEYSRLLEALEKVNQTENTRNMLLDFRQKWTELQLSHLKGEVVPKEKAQQINKTIEALEANPTMNEYRTAELSLLRMMERVEKIIWEGMNEVLLLKPTESD